MFTTVLRQSSRRMDEIKEQVGNKIARIIREDALRMLGEIDKRFLESVRPPLILMLQGE
jgi:hypothetical protein